MKPIIYRFSINDHYVYPVYKSDLTLDWELESLQQFFRKKLSGSLSFIGKDYDWLNEQDFETEFILLLEQSLDGGKTWKEWYKGKFMKTDCKWDDDNKKCEVQPDVYDQYNDVIAGLEKEFNLIQLAPEIVNIKIKKRPLIQVYSAGDTVVSCIIGGTYWEKDVTESSTDEDYLVNTCHFAKASTKFRIIVDGGTDLSQAANGEYVGDSNKLSQVGGNYILLYYEKKYNVSTGAVTILENGYNIVLKNNQDVSVWTFSQYRDSFSGDPTPDKFLDIPNSFTLTPVSTSQGLVNLNATRSDVNIYMRYLTNSTRIDEKDTYPITDNDIVENNRNYRYVIGFNYSLFFTSEQTQVKPTEWGLSSNGEYFVKPYTYSGTYFPIARSTWGIASYWFLYDSVYTNIFEEDGTSEFILKHAYPVSSCINVLLQEIAPGITHEANAEYSNFLYASRNPVTGQNFTLIVAPKSNILTGEYQTPALKATTTLQNFLNMLRDCYRCYWYIEDNKLKIEHISYFKRGGTYNSVSNIGVDITSIENPRNKKKWGFMTSNYEYDKEDMPERYQFSWMDEVTDAFDGQPIEILSKYTLEGKIEEINISSFTPDIDYMLLNPGAISSDGFALFSAQYTEGIYTLPVVQRIINGTDLKMQNGYCSWVTLQPNYYIYDLPAKRVKINGTETLLEETSRKKKQTVKFPSIEELDTTKLVKTYLGNGQIEKISVNLSSRINEVTLKYDTE